jgi:hypothetical protein
MKTATLALLVTGGLTANAQGPAYPGAPPAPSRLVRAEYFFDTDPGQGQGTAIAVTPATIINAQTNTIALNGSALTNGFHRLFLRVQQANGIWSLPAHHLFANVVIRSYPPATSPAALVEMEYFIDTDPGLGRGHKISLPNTPNISTGSALINLSNLSAGAHRLYVRSKDATGNWSLNYYAIFENNQTVPYPTMPAPAPALTQVEYYIDTDPGLGQGTIIDLPATTTDLSLEVDISLGSLSQGRHVLYLRGRQNPWSLTAYTEFQLGAILPVQWLYVKGETTSDDDVQLSWATATEQNTDKYTIEYSRDGRHFAKAGEVVSKNNATGSTYSFLHAHPGAGTIYYRIKQVDLDGHATYSRVIFLLLQKELDKPVLFPNPVTNNGTIHLALPVDMRPLSIEVIDGAGRVLKRLNPPFANTSITIQVNELPKGAYYVRIKEQTGYTTLSFIK